MRLLKNLGDAPGADGPAAFANRELQAILHGDRLDQLDLHVGPVARHDHLGALGEGHHAGHVRGTEVELRPVVVEERRVPPALILRQDVDLALELGVRGVGARLDDDLAALHVLALDAAQQQAHVVARLAVVEDLAEHLHTGDGGGLWLGLDADDVDGLAGVHRTALDPAGHHGAAAGDGEHVLHWHEERLVDLAYRLRDRVVAGGHELHDLLAPLGVALQRLERGDANHRDVGAGELVLSEQLADLKLDELEDLLVVHHVRLVQRHHDVGDANLAGQQHVLTGLRHRTISGRDHEDGTVHLRRTRDHVLDVVRVTWAVHVRVVTLLGLVLDVRDRDRDAALLLLLRVVDLIEGGEGVNVRHLVVQHFGDRRGQRGLAMVDVPDGAHVDVRLSPLELGLRHWFLLVGFDPPAGASGGGAELTAWLLASRLGDNLLGDAGRNLGIRIELHAVIRPALRPAAQIPHVAEHLRQRDKCLDCPGPGSFLHGLDLATAAAQVADDLTHVVLGRPDLDGHDRLEQHGIRLAGGLLERHRTGDLEGELGRVHLVVSTVGQRHLHVDHRGAGQDAELGGLLAARVHRGNVLPGDTAAGHLVLELVPAAVAAGGLEVDQHPGVLARAAGLLLVRVLDLLDLAPDRLAVSDLRAADVRLDLELAAHPVDQHLEVEFTHPGDDRLAGFLVGPDLEGRVLFGEPLDRGAQPLLVALGLRLDGHVDDRRRERHRLQDARRLDRGQRVSRGGVLQAHHRDDLPGDRERALLALVRVHLVDLADPLPAALDRVQHVAARLQGARVDADVGELAEVLVGHDLEGERGERLVGVGAPLHELVLVAHRVALHRRDVDRAGQVVHDRVEHGLDALVLERGPAQHRGQR